MQNIKKLPLPNDRDPTKSPECKEGTIVLISTKSAAFYRIIPFSLYLAFIALEDGLRFLNSKDLINIPSYFNCYLYPVKVLAVAAALFLFKHHYNEIILPAPTRIRQTALSVLIGLLVFAIWINMDLPSGMLGSPNGFNPNVFQNDSARITFSLIRILGAVIVVPVMEELFWRSFLIRYVISHDFMNITLGTFTWPSFIISALLFGLEHNLYLAGILAGIAYNLLLYRTKSIAQCILAHATTNLALGIYVLYSEKWYFW